MLQEVTNAYLWCFDNLRIACLRIGGGGFSE
jgi:hypothetical protein